MELSNCKLPVQRFFPVYRTVKVAAEPDRIDAVIHSAYELDKKDGSLFSLQKDVELVCGFILSFFLLSTGNSVYRADALPSTIPYHSLVNRLRFEVHVAVPYEPLYANTKGGKDAGKYNAASRALILQLSNDGRQEQTERHIIIVLCMARAWLCLTKTHRRATCTFPDLFLCCSASLVLLPQD
jgi:hypothetical protein